MKTITLSETTNTSRTKRQTNIITTVERIPQFTNMSELQYIVYMQMQKYPHHSSAEVWARTTNSKSVYIDFLEWNACVDYLINNKYIVETMCYKGSNAGLIDNKEIPTDKFTYIENAWFGNLSSKS